MKIADLFARLGLRTDKKAFTAGDRLLTGIKTALVGVVAFKSVKWFGSLITDTAQSADQFAKMSKQIGISTEGLQQLEFAAEISGSNIAVLRTGLQRFARTADDTTRGSKEAKDAFKEVSLSATDAAGNLKPVDVLLAGVADKFATMEDGTKKTAVAMRLFGRSGALLIPLLNEGSAGIDKLRKEFVELGGQISGESAAAFEQMNDDTLRVKTALRGLRNQAVIALLPVISKLVKGLLAWVKANKKLLQKRLQTAMKVLLTILITVGKVLGTVIDILSVMEGHFDLLAIAIMSAVVAFKVLKFASIKAALASAAAWTLALFPFVLMAAAIAAVALLVQDLWKWFSGGDSVLKELWQSFKTGVADGISGLVKDSIDGWRMLFTKFFAWVKDRIEWVGRKIRSVARSIKTFITGGGALKRVIAKAKELQRQRRLNNSGRPPGSAGRLPSDAQILRQVRERTTAANRPAGVGGSVTNNVTINQSPGQSAGDVAREVTKQTDRNMRNAAAAAGN